MKAKGTHEGCIEQIQRLFATQMYNGSAPAFDEAGRVRLDDREMQPDVQHKVAEIWPLIKTENLPELTDLDGYRTEFLKLFGFGLPGVDYDADVDPHVTS
jgi:enoyl-[acyl-carrier protein] reductase/trans-2-enoyl-CoA reductase (NAD+)